MKATIQITDETLFNNVVCAVDTSDLKCVSSITGVYKGIVDIELLDGAAKTIHGEHDAHDYERDYGFIFVPHQPLEGVVNLS